MEIVSNPQLQLAFDFVQYTGKNIFLTGKAGSGKTTFLHTLKKTSLKRTIVVAPTGVAAINAGGVTIHSFFQMPFGPQIPENEQNNPRSSGNNEKNSGRAIRRFSRDKIAIIKSMDLLVIDEISMVRADLLDGIDSVLRRFRNRSKPFGGVQLLMIGDIQQLAPVVKDDEWQLLKQYYDTVFFFSSIALQKTNFISIELKHIYRQSDAAFIDTLNKIRNNNMDTETLRKLNERYIPGFIGKETEGYIILTTHNKQAQQINQARLHKLEGESFTFTATIEGDFPEYSFPTDPELELKNGAQVMFVKNDSSAEKLYYNGKIGTVTDIDEGTVYVECDDQSSPIPVDTVVWENMKYEVDNISGDMRESVTGTFAQLPLKLAWAITIHKSQGLTFEKAIIDANAAFAHGQVYVALSRCKTLDGLVLNSPINTRSLISDTTVSEFNRDVENNEPGNKELEQSKNDYRKMLMLELFDFKSLLGQIYYIIKILTENSGSVQGDPDLEFHRRKDLFKSQVTDVSAKFERQLNYLFEQSAGPENEEKLQERVKKGSTYFLEKIESILSNVLEGVSIESDNRAVRKALTEAIKKLEELTLVKIDCLKACNNGFSVSKYLDTKARAAVQKAVPKKPKKEKAASPVSTAHPELYARLKTWRNEKASELDLPHYMILPLKAMNELASKLPATTDNLSGVKGIGKKKKEKFGDEIIKIIADYCEEKNIDASALEINAPQKPKKPKINTKQVSFDLLNSGKTIKEIAEERGMAQTTIEGHLAHFVGTGDLDINRFVNPEKIKIITEYFHHSDNNLLSAAKEALGDTISYGEIKFVLKHMEMMAK